MRRIIVIFISLFLLVSCSSASSQAQVDSPIESSVVVESQEIDEGDDIDRFVKAFNLASEEQLEYKEDFVPSERENGHYRTEFRLSAYKEAVGRSYRFGDAEVDFILRTQKDYLSGGTETVIRIYVENASLDQCKQIIEISSPIMDDDITPEDIQSAIDYIEKNDQANGYYYSDLCIVMFRKGIDKYELMIKMGND